MRIRSLFPCPLRRESVSLKFTSRVIRATLSDAKFTLRVIRATIADAEVKIFTVNEEPEEEEPVDKIFKTNNNKSTGE